MRWSKTWMIAIGFASVAVPLLLLQPLVAWAQEAAGRQVMDPTIIKWGFIAAAASVGSSSLAGAIAVAMVGAAAMGAVGERPEIAPRALIFVGLAEGLAIYGLIVAIMILGKI
jgi:V/A-type H+/Na+-transporting ATPase subunit K